MDLDLESELVRPFKRGLWSQLPGEVLLIILAKLPAPSLVRMRAVCKGWNHLLSSARALKIIYRNVQFPAFFLHLPRTRGAEWGKDCPVDDMQSWIIEPVSGHIYKVPMPNFDNADSVRRQWGNRVPFACKNIYCCTQRDTSGRLMLSICNPSATTWTRLPYPLHITGWSFYAMALDPSTGHYTLLLGHYEYDDDEESDNEWDYDDREIEIEIYNSETNAWAQIHKTLPYIIGSPVGRGVYSKGRVYWLRERGSGDLVEFNVAERIWNKIPQPKWAYLSNPQDLDDLVIMASVYRRSGIEFYNSDGWDGPPTVKINAKDEELFPSSSWLLAGADNRVVLVNKEIPSMWEMREDSDGRNRWCPVHIRLPKPLYGVAVSSSGRILAAGEKIVIYNGDRRKAVRTIDFSELEGEVPESFDPFLLSETVWEFEWNSSWWQ